MAQLARIVLIVGLLVAAAAWFVFDPNYRVGVGIAVLLLSTIWGLRLAVGLVFPNDLEDLTRPPHD
jgi:hypothetical protein